jgi:hypothetical protein
VAEYYRYTGHAAMVDRMWPRIAAAIAHMDSLRAERRTAEWRAPEKRRYFGLLLPSISHEGYANPMHSYWDDFFAYRGYVDAAYLAGVSGREPERVRIAASRDTFAHDLAASVAATCASAHRLRAGVRGPATSTPPRPLSALLHLCCRPAPRGGLASHVRALLEVLYRSPRRPGEMGRIHALRSARDRRVRALGLARSRERSPHVLHGAP